jgi:hypothetical protein
MPLILIVKEGICSDIALQSRIFSLDFGSGDYALHEADGATTSGGGSAPSAKPCTRRLGQQQSFGLGLAGVHPLPPWPISLRQTLHIVGDDDLRRVGLTDALQVF